MIKKLIGTCIAATVLAVTGKVVSDYAETKPALKNVKDKLKKTEKDFSANCKEVLDATRRVFTGGLGFIVYIANGKGRRCYCLFPMSG